MHYFEELRFLHEDGVDYAQGYAIGKPGEHITFTVGKGSRVVGG